MVTDRLPLTIEKVKAGSVTVASKAKEMIAFVSKQDDPVVLKECKAQAVAVEAYLAQRWGGKVEDYNAAVKVKTRVEHRLGEVLSGTVNHKGTPGPGRGKTGNVMLPVSGEIPDGISKMQSSRAQQLASIPWEEIESKIDAATEQNKRASQSRVVREIAKEKDGGESNVYSFADHIGKFQRLFDKFSGLWSPSDRVAMCQFFKQLAKDLE